MKENVKKTKRINKPALAGLWYTAGSILERGSAVIFTPIYTRLLLPSEYGIYSLFVGFAGIVTVFATLEISGGAVYRGLKEFGKDSPFIPSALGLISLSSLFFLLLYLIFSAQINAVTKLSTPLTLLLFLQVFLNGIRALKISEVKFSYGRRLPLAEGIFFSLITPLLSILFIFFGGMAQYGRIYATLVSSAVFSLPVLFSVLRKSKGRLYDKKIWTFLLKYSIPALPHFLSMSLIWQIGKITVANAFSSAEAGLLSLSLSVGLLPTLLSTGAHSALIPWITRKLGEGKGGREKIHSAVSSIFFPLCLTVTLFLLVCPELFRLLASESYYGALKGVYPIACAVPTVFLVGIFSSEISYYKKTLFVTLGSVAGAVFNLVCNVLFTFRVGYLFSELLILPTFLIICASYILILRYKFKDRELPIKKLFLNFITFLFFSVLAALLQISLLARILLFAAVVMLIFPKINEIKNLLGEH